MSFFPHGRPKWLIKMMDAPCVMQYFIVGKDARILKLLIIPPDSSIGTLKSTRIKMRLSLKLKSDIFLKNTPEKNLLISDI